MQGTRPAEILKLWLGLRQLGLDGIEAILDGAIARRRQLQGLLASDASLVVCSGPMHLVAFTPVEGDAAAAEAWSQSTRQALLAEQLMVSRPLYQGKIGRAHV